MNLYVQNKERQASIFFYFLNCFGYESVDEIPYPAYAQPILALDTENKNSKWQWFYSTEN